MKAIYKAPFRILPELMFLGGLTLFFYVFLSPAVWFNPNMNLLSFEPYSPPDGYTPFNPCGSVVYHANYTPPSIPNGKAYTGPAQNRRTWIGYMGTCNRDDDGRVFCTKGDIGKPQWNLTYVQANDVIYPARMPSIIKTGPVFASIIFACLAFLLFVWISLPYHFSDRLIKHRPWSGGMTLTLSILMFCCGALSLITFATASLSHKNVDRYLAVDNFYLQAPCGSQRQLKDGVLMRAKTGNAWKVLWAAWFLCAIPTVVGCFWRTCVKWPSSDATKTEKANDTEAAVKKDEETVGTEKAEGSKPHTPAAETSALPGHATGPPPAYEGSTSIASPAAAPTLATPAAADDEPAPNFPVASPAPSKNPFAKDLATEHNQTPPSTPGQTEEESSHVIQATFVMPSANPAKDDETTARVRYTEQQERERSEIIKRKEVERNMGWTQSEGHGTADIDEVGGAKNQFRLL